MTAMSNKSVFISFVISLSFLIPAMGRPSPISVGGTVIEIPNPPGFAAVTPEMTKFHRLTQQFVPPGNEELVSYISESEIPQALNDQLSEVGRWFSVQTDKKWVGVSVSASDFSELKQVLKTQTDELPKEVEASPGLLENLKKGLTKQSAGTIPASVLQIVSLRPHDETDRTLACSMFAKGEHRDGVGNPTYSIVVTTLTVVHVKDKVLALCCNAEEGGWRGAERFQSGGSILSWQPMHWP